MRTISEQLRMQAEYIEKTGRCCNIPLLREAADRLEQLEADLQEIADYVPKDGHGLGYETPRDMARKARNMKDESTDGELT